MKVRRKSLKEEEGEVADLFRKSDPYARTTLRATLSTGVQRVGTGADAFLVLYYIYKLH
jgi:hypothetical protein